MKKLFTALLMILATSTHSAELGHFKKIECTSADQKIAHTIWPVTYDSNSQMFILSGYYMSESLSEEIENGGVPIFTKIKFPNYSYEVQRTQIHQEETIFILKAPGQYFQAEQSVILKTSDFKTGRLSKGYFASSSSVYPTAWNNRFELNCTFK